MNKLDAIRTFAKPGFCPVRHTRIHKDRFYLVTMQNVERNPLADYVGLGEGTYTELVSGTEARNRRDARLNHCNEIAEYHGAVFAVYANRYGNEDMLHAGYFPSIDAANGKVKELQAKHDEWIAACRKDADYHKAQADGIRAGTVKSIMSSALHEQSAQECLRVAAEREGMFRSDILQVRSASAS